MVLAQSFCLSHSSRANFEVQLVAITRSHPSLWWQGTTVGQTAAVERGYR